MSARTRHYVVTLVTVAVAVAWTQIAGHWSDLEFYAVAAGLLTLIGLVGLPWIECAPDGAFRQSPAERPRG